MGFRWLPYDLLSQREEFNHRYVTPTTTGKLPAKTEESGRSSVVQPRVLASVTNIIRDCAETQFRRHR
jgi:hypothetical protein